MIKGLTQIFTLLKKETLTFLDFLAGCIALQSDKKQAKLLNACYRLISGEHQVLRTQNLFDALRNSQAGVDWPFVNEVRALVAHTKRDMLTD